jgi:hypothetical protein
MGSERAADLAARLGFTFSLLTPALHPVQHIKQKGTDRTVTTHTHPHLIRSQP